MSLSSSPQVKNYEASPVTHHVEKLTWPSPCRYQGSQRCKLEQLGGLKCIQGGVQCSTGLLGVAGVLCQGIATPLIDPKRVQISGSEQALHAQAILGGFGRNCPACKLGSGIHFVQEFVPGSWPIGPYLDHYGNGDAPQFNIPKVHIVRQTPIPGCPTFRTGSVETFAGEGVQGNKFMHNGTRTSDDRSFFLPSAVPDLPP